MVARNSSTLDNVRMSMRLIARRIPVVMLLLLLSCAQRNQSDGLAETAPVSATATTAMTPTTLATPVSTTAAATATSVEPRSPTPGWEPLRLAPTGVAGSHLTVAATDGEVTVLAVCDTQAAGLGREGALSVWWATGNLEWEAVSLPATDRCVNQIENTPFGFFASTPGQGLWSEDGKDWRIWGAGNAVNPELAGLGSVHAIFPATGEDRLTLLLLGPAPGESTVATLITTTDGTTWARGPDGVASEFDNTTIAGIHPGGDGLLAFGSSPGGEFTPTAAVFTSSDGLNWRRVTPRNPDFNSKVITDVVAFDEGFVAVGGDFFKTGLMTAWTSPDGITWNRSPHPDETVNPRVASSTANTVTVSNGRIWAAGVDYDASRSQDQLAALWVSDDGLAWTRTEITDESDVIPFTLLTNPETSLGVWPPNNTPSADPYQLFKATR